MNTAAWAMVWAGITYSAVSICLAFFLAWRNRFDPSIRKAYAVTTQITIFDVIKSRSWDQLRALLYIVVPLIIAASVKNHTWEWTGLALAILTPSIASWKSVTGFRTAFQGIISALQILLVALHLVTNAQFTTWAQIALAIIGGGVAAANVHAKRDQPTVIDQDGNVESGPAR